MGKTMNDFILFDFRTPVEQRGIKPEPVIRNHHDWKIHKILDEAKRVYICPARGNDKLYTQLELYTELMAQNKEITFMRKKDLPKKDPWKGSRALLNLDKDLICNIEPRWLQDAIDRYIEEEMKKTLQEKNDGWTPKVRFDSWIVDDDLYFKEMLWDHLVLSKDR